MWSCWIRAGECESTTLFLFDDMRRGTRRFGVRKPVLCGALVCAFFTQGCLIVPVPLAAHNPEAFGSRSETSKEKLTEFRDGVTTRERVVLGCGEPDRAWEHDRYMLYVSDTARGFVAVLFVGPSGGAGGGFYTGDKHLLLLEFDGGGVLRRHGVVACALNRTQDQITELCRAWIEGPDPAPPARASDPSTH